MSRFVRVMKKYFAIFLCLLFVFATSGNSRGLIFKNLAKTYHSIHIDNQTQVPSPEEINEQINEHKVLIKYFINLPHFTESNAIDHRFANFLRNVSPHILEIPVPPPEL